jgi:hypothetical protein
MGLAPRVFDYASFEEFAEARKLWDAGINPRLEKIKMRLRTLAIESAAITLRSEELKKQIEEVNQELKVEAARVAPFVAGSGYQMPPTHSEATHSRASISSSCSIGLTLGTAIYRLES